ncbi:hypothetical protein PINS_up007350 [Pythium insidiosum]|nr:hypothetical protein PINS_up007350 [Pythium insidiosum]
MIRKAQSDLCLSQLSTTSTATSSSSLCLRDSFITSSGAGHEPLEEWIYWQRDQANAACWTKVFAVLQNEFLWFFQNERKAKTLLLQIAVASVEESGERQLRIVDPNGESIEIWLVDRFSFDMWRHRLQDASVLTAQYFNAFSVDVKSLPRSSAFRGSLVSERRVRKRDRCRAALVRLALKWRQSLLADDRNTM